MPNKITKIGEPPILTITKGEIYYFPCPACGHQLQTTTPKSGKAVDCKCGNRTWGPEYVPKWSASALAWALANKVIVSLIVSGIVASLTLSVAWAKGHFP